jgi:AcrR family transcriptional regulator
MFNSTADRRSALKDRLILAAEQTIMTKGLGALKARDLALEAGCALGAIYTVFPTLTDLILAVNARTFARLFAAATAFDPPADPVRHLVALAQAYHRFAAANRPAWAALFAVDHGAAPAPDWYRAAMDQLFQPITEPLSRALPDLPAPDRDLLARTLFSAVHGIVALAMDRNSGGVPEDQVDRMLDLMLSRLGQRSVS